MDDPVATLPREGEKDSLCARRAARGSVLIVMGTLETGGTEKQVVMLAEALSARGWTVVVYCFSRGGRVLAERLRRSGIRLVFGPHRPEPVRPVVPAAPGRTGAVSGKTRAPPTRPSLRALARNARAVAWIAGHTLRSRPTAVHAFLPLTNLLGALGARAGIARLVVTSRRSLGMYQDTHPRFGRIDRWSNRLSDIVVANSNAVAEAVAARDGYPLGRIVVIPNGVDMPEDAGPASRIALRHGLGLDEDALAIVSVANLVPYKGHMELIEAFGMVSGKHPAARLFIVGEDRGIGDRLRALVARHALGDRVTFLGSRNDVPVLLGAMDAGVLASHHEGNSNAVLEKLAAGLPVIATDVGGNTEAIAGLPGCQLVRPRDPADIARGLLSVLDRLPESGAIRDARRQAVRDRFSVTAMVEAYERLYLAGRRGRR